MSASVSVDPGVLRNRMVPIPCFRWLGRLFFPLAALATGTLLINTAHAQDRVVVFAAASTAEAVLAAANIFESNHDGLEVLTSFASSSTLARQIEAGAPANLYISANTVWMDYLDSRGQLAEATRFNLLRNRLGLVVPADTRLSIEIAPGFGLVEALDGGRLAIGDPDHVPAGIYGRAALKSLGVWSKLEPHLARAADVRAAIVMVERGEAAAGIVYATDAAISKHVRLVGLFPENEHPPIQYPVAIPAAGDTPAARKLLTFLRSETGTAIFRTHGFATERD